MEPQKAIYMQSEVYFMCGDHQMGHYLIFGIKSDHFGPFNGLFRGQKARFGTFWGPKRAQFAPKITFWGSSNGQKGLKMDQMDQ